MTNKYIHVTFLSGYAPEGSRGFATVSGKTVTLNIGVYSNEGFGAGEIVATIPTNCAPLSAFASGCFIGSEITKIESVGYAYINTKGEILIGDCNFTKRRIARLIVSYQIA